MPFCVGYGLIAFQPFGRDYAAVGVHAGLWGGVATALVAALVGGTHAKATAPIVAGALLLADLFRALATDPRMPIDPGERLAVAVGLAALTVGAAGLSQGGLPGGGAASLSTMNYRCGGRTLVAGVGAALTLTLFIVALGRFLPLIPKVVLASIVVVGAVRLIDPWVLRLCRAALAPERRADRATVLTNLGLMAGVAAIAFVFDLITAIIAGLLASSGHFIVREARVRFRLTYRGNKVHSKRARPREDIDDLATLGRAIAVFELQGPIFFGSAERVVARIKREAADASHIVIGLGRVDEIDASGFRVLYQFLLRMRRREGRDVLISHLTTAHSLWPLLADMGVEPREVGRQFFADTDAALEWAEDRVLETRRHGRGPRPEVTLAEIDVLQDAPPEMLEWLAGHLTHRTYPAGTVIIREGDEDRSLYLMTAGTVSVLAAATNGAPGPRRLASFSAGTVFGEIAFLDGGRRSASAVADGDVSCDLLTRKTFERLRRERMDFAATLLANLSLDLVHRLRTATTEIRALQS